MDGVVWGLSDLGGDSGFRLTLYLSGWGGLGWNRVRLCSVVFGELGNLTEMADGKDGTASASNMHNVLRRIVGLFVRFDVSHARAIASALIR